MTVEPKHKCVLIKTGLRGGSVTVYFSKPFWGDVDESTPDRLVIGAYEVTDEDVERGWVDLDDKDPGVAADSGGHLHRAMQLLSKGLSYSLEASGAVGHRLLKGELREAQVRFALRPHVPRHYELGSGVAVNAAGGESDQLDIVISDPTISPPFIAGGLLGVYPIEVVAGAIEVKSWADPDEIRKAVSNIASMKALVSDAPRAGTWKEGPTVVHGYTSEKPFGGIVCLQSRSTPDTVYNAYYSAVLEQPLANRPNALIVIDEFAITWRSGTPEESLLEVSPLGGELLVRADLRQHSLLLFYLVLTQALSVYTHPPLELLDYVNAGGGFPKHVRATTMVPEGVVLPGGLRIVAGQPPAPQPGGPPSEGSSS